MAAVNVPQINLPIGISFYVFQSMSYIIDVYRDDAPVQKNPIAFGTYVTLFPQLILKNMTLLHVKIVGIPITLVGMLEDV